RRLGLETVLYEHSKVLVPRVTFMSNADTISHEWDIGERSYSVIPSTVLETALAQDLGTNVSIIEQSSAAVMADDANAFVVKCGGDGQVHPDSRLCLWAECKLNHQFALLNTTAIVQ